MATNDFLAVGGDTYATLADNYLESGILIGINLEDALIDYISTIEDNCASYAEPAGRIVIVADEPEIPDTPDVPETGAVSIIGFGIAAIVSGTCVTIFRKK